MASYIKRLIEPKFVCDNCDELHDDEDDAYSCCKPSIHEVYCCPICNYKNDTEADAIDCCGFDPDGTTPRVSAAELEKHGQLRIEGM